MLVDADEALAKVWGAYGTRTYGEATFTGTLRSQFVIDENGKIIDVQAPVAAPKSLELALITLGIEPAPAQ